MTTLPTSHKPPRTNLFEEGVDEADSLNGLAQAHLICQDGVRVLGPGEAQPVQSLQLIRVQVPASLIDKLWLFIVTKNSLRKGGKEMHGERKLRGGGGN